MSEVEVEQGPAVAGPAEAQQPIRAEDAVVSPLDEAPPADKVYNLSDEEINRQAAGDGTALGEYETK